MVCAANICSKPDADPIDEKKRKRMISNRESARRSRIRRQKHMQDLINEKAQLERKLNEDNLTYVALLQSYNLLESENTALKGKTLKLTHYLDYLHKILGSYSQTETEHHHQQALNPWQVNGPAKPIAASGMFV